MKVRLIALITALLFPLICFGIRYLFEYCLIARIVFFVGMIVLLQVGVYKLVRLVLTEMKKNEEK